MGLVIVLIIILIVIVIFISSNYDIKRRGIQTTGKVINVSSRTTTDMYGVRHTTYYLTYEFQDANGKRYTGEKSTSSQGRKVVGDSVPVYYLQERPERNDIDL